MQDNKISHNKEEIVEFINDAYNLKKQDKEMFLKIFYLLKGITIGKNGVL